MRQLVRSPRFVLSVVCVLAAGAGAMIAAERSSAAMADCGQRVRRQPDARTAPAGGVPVRVRRAHALALHPDREVPAEGAHRQGDDRGAARRSRTTLLKAGLSQRGYMTATVHHGARERARRIERRERGAAGRGAARRSRRDPVTLLRLGVRHAVGQGHVGLARRGPSRLAALHGGQGQRSSPARRRSSASNPAEVRDGPKQGHARSSAAEEDTARELLTALDATQRATGGDQRPRRRTTS